MQSPRDFSLYGAVDLGARQAAAQRRQQQAARAATAADAGDGGRAEGPASAFVIDVTEETFNNEVALRSRSTPVTVRGGPAVRIPTRRATASAVSAWSPVTMTTRMPARWQASMMVARLSPLRKGLWKWKGSCVG